jgi:hypothetical protein
MYKSRFCLLLVLGLALAPTVHAARSKAELVDLLKVVDQRQRNSGDWRSQDYI